MLEITLERARRRSLTAALLTVGSLALAACGDDASNTIATVDSAAAVETTAVEPATVGSPGTDPSDSSAPHNATPATAVADPGIITVTIGVDDATTLGARTAAVAKGTAVTLTVKASEAQQIHVHGYDLEATASPEAAAVFQFTADQTGTFEVESHDTGQLLLELVVG